MVLLCITSVLAEATFSIVPPKNVIAGRNFTVTYRLKNGQGTGLSVPDIEGCKKLYGPAQSTMQSFEYINGKQSSSYIVEYTYTYKAEKEGSYTIQPATITVDGHQLRTQSATFKVLPPDGNTSGSNSNGNASPNSPGSQSSDQEISEQDVFIRVIPNKAQAYKEEAIECTMKLYTRFSSINGISAAAPPTFDGFLIDELGDVPDNGGELEHYNGKNYQTFILKKYIIFPQQTGKLTINSGQYDIDVIQYERVYTGFWGYTQRPVQKTVHVKPGNFTINVLPLPQPQPDNFSGAVGSFSVSSDISSTSLRTNEAASLSLKITGSGNIKYIKEPSIDFPAEFEQYTPKVDINAAVYGNTIRGTNSIEYTFVPQAVGSFTIPEYEFVYFNPSTKKYETASTTRYELNVAKGANSPATIVSEQQSIQAKNTDILHIKLGDKQLLKDNTPIIYSAWYWLIYILTVVVLAVVIAINAKRIKLSADVIGTKKARANKVAKKRLKAAETFMKKHDIDAFYEELLRAIWGYLSDKLSMPASQLTRQNITEEMLKNGIPQDVINDLISVIDECEMARYTPSISDETVSNTFDKTSAIIGKIEQINK